MSSHKVIWQGGEQALVYAPPKRVTSADFVIEDFVTYASGSDNRIIAFGEAVLNGLDTGITQAAGSNTADPRLLVVDSIADVTASHRYVITNSSTGQYETLSVDSHQGLNIKTEVPLMGKYPSGSFVQGIELSAAFPEDSAKDETLLNNDEPLRIVWKYTVDGFLTHQQELIRLVHHNKSDIDIDGVIKEIQSAWGGFGVRFEDGRNMRGMVAFCVRDVRRILLSRNLKPEEFLTGEQGFQMIYWRTLWHFGMLGNSPVNVDLVDFREEAKAQFESSINSLTIGHPGAEVKKADHINDQGTPQGGIQYRSIIRKA